MEWVLVSCGSTCTIYDDASPTPNLEPSQPSPSCTECLHEPTATEEPARKETTEPTIALDPEPVYTSDQVCEPTTPHVPEGVVMEYEGMERILPLLRVSNNWPLEAFWIMVKWIIFCIAMYHRSSSWFRPALNLLSPVCSLPTFLSCLLSIYLPVILPFFSWFL